MSFTAYPDYEEDVGGEAMKEWEAGHGLREAGVEVCAIELAKALTIFLCMDTIIWYTCILDIGRTFCLEIIIIWDGQ